MNEKRQISPKKLHDSVQGGSRWQVDINMIKFCYCNRGPTGDRGASQFYHEGLRGCEDMVIWGGWGEGGCPALSWSAWVVLYSRLGAGASAWNPAWRMTDGQTTDDRRADDCATALHRTIRRSDATMLGTLPCRSRVTSAVWLKFDVALKVDPRGGATTSHRIPTH